MTSSSIRDLSPIRELEHYDWMGCTGETTTSLGELAAVVSESSAVLGLGLDPDLACLGLSSTYRTPDEEGNGVDVGHLPAAEGLPGEGTVAVAVVRRLRVVLLSELHPWGQVQPVEQPVRAPAAAVVEGGPGRVQDPFSRLRQLSMGESYEPCFRLFKCF